MDIRHLKFRIPHSVFRTPSLLRWSLLLLALGHLLLYLFVALRRLAYPYDLEWMEGGAADHVLRVLAGRPLYVAPSLDFIPFIYPPLYFYVCALVSKFTGAGMLPLRLVSFLASLGCFTLVAAFVRRETRAWFPALLAGALYAAAYPLGGFWFDLARVDSLFMLLVLGGVYVLRGATRASGLVLAGALFALAFLTKQSALTIALPLVLYSLLFLPPRQKLIFPATLALLAGAATLALDRASGGWFRYYIFFLPRHHPLELFYIKQFWIRDMIRPLVIALGIALLYFERTLRAGRRRDAAFFGLFTAGMIGTAWASRLHSGGFNNVLLPAHAALAILLGLGLRQSSGVPPSGGIRLSPSAEPASSPRTELFFLILCLIQFATLYYDPFEQLPNAQDRAAGDALIQQIRAISGDVYIPYHGHLGPLAGKPAHAQWMSILDVERADPAQKIRLENEINGAYANRRFAAIIADDGWPLGEYENKTYRYAGRAFRFHDVFKTRAGMQTGPSMIYRAIPPK